MQPDESPETPREAPGPLRTTRLTLLSILLGALALAVGFVGFKLLVLLRQEPRQEARPAITTAVHVLPARRGEYRERLTGYGRARPLRRAQVPAEIAAAVTWVSPRLEAGNRVAAGEELVRLDPRDAQAAVDAAAARLGQAEAKRTRAASDGESLDAQIAVADRELGTARRELARIVELLTKATSESEVDTQRMAVSLREQTLLGLRGRRSTARADEAAAEAEVAAARAALEQARHDLERAVVRAPYGGWVVARAAQAGERVTPGAALFTLVDLSHVEIPVTLPASRHGEVVVGAPAEVRLQEGGDVVWRGAVSRVAPDVDPERRVFEAYLDVVGEPGAAAPIAPGAFTVVTVEGLRTEGVVAVPREALVGDALYVAEPDGAPDAATGARPAAVREVHPRIVRRMPDTVLVADGLGEGELIVVTSVDQVADGTRVLLLPEEPADVSTGAER